jgi:surface protein
MVGMFGGCQSLISIDLSSINTSKVKKMNDLFWKCKSLQFLNLSNFDTSEVTTMYGRFYN